MGLAVLEAAEDQWGSEQETSTAVFISSLRQRVELTRMGTRAREHQGGHVFPKPFKRGRQRSCIWMRNISLGTSSSDCPVN
jgi:hypothetical protein